MSRGLVVTLVAAAVALVLGLTLALTRDPEEAPPSAAGGAGPSGLDVSTAGWKTDFSRHSVPLTEFHSGGPPRDGIPPVDEPRFAPVSRVTIPDREPVVAVEIDGLARAYPIRILIWHEIVNDTLAGEPIAVTFCPLCNTAVAFRRTLDGRALTFGTTGNLRFSDLVMWDRQTETWWQQFSGAAVVGELTGARLERVPAQLIALGEFRERYPEGEVLSEETGHQRPYGANPYSGYDDADSPPFLLRDRSPDGRLAPKARVVSIQNAKALVAVPLDALMRRPVIDVRVAGLSAVVWWSPGAASALDSRAIAAGRDVGSVVVYDRRAAGRVLSFSPNGKGICDAETGSRWDRDGRAVAGPLTGARLRAVVHDTPFWFAVAAFRPDARIVTGGA